MSLSPRMTAGISILTAATALLVVQPRTAGAQTADSLSDAATISLITVLPGDAVYSLFGHSAVRVKDPAQDLDASFSYGTFHFDDPMFVPKFIRGDLNYFLSVARFGTALRLYRDVEGRPVIEQPLNLDGDQRNRLYAFLRENARPENRYYQYDFLFDNCSTRIRDALEFVFAGEIAYSDTVVPPATFRQLLHPYLRERSFLRLGIDLVLGAPVDRAASARDRTFLPDYLSSSFDTAVLTDSLGTTKPLVARRDTLMWVSGYDRPGRTAPWAAVVLTVIAVGLAALTLRESRRNRAIERVDVLLFGLTGLIGVFLLFMWLGTEHRVTAANWNLAWAWPTHLIYAAVLARTGLTRFTVGYASISALAMVVLVAVWALVPQDLPEPTLAIAAMIIVRGAWLYLYARRSVSVVIGSSRS